MCVAWWTLSQQKQLELQALTSFDIRQIKNLGTVQHPLKWVQLQWLQAARMRC